MSLYVSQIYYIIKYNLLKCKIIILYIAKDKKIWYYYISDAYYMYSIYFQYGFIFITQPTFFPVKKKLEARGLELYYSIKNLRAGGGGEAPPTWNMH